MDAAGKVSPRRGMNGELRKRVSPRLHSNLDSHIACDSNSKQACAYSAQRRFSPRLNPNRLDSSQQSSIQTMLSPNLSDQSSILSPKLSELHVVNSPTATPPIQLDSENLTPEVLPEDSSFQRRMSPRLHGGLASKTQIDVCEDSSGTIPDHRVNSAAEIQRRLSPRLHQNSVNRGQEAASKDSVIQSRLSPRLNCQQEKETQKSLLNSATHGKRLGNDIHPNNGVNAKRNKLGCPKEDGYNLDARHSHSNDTICASNGGIAHQLNLGIEALQRKSKIHGKATDVAGRNSYARVKETLRTFNTYYLQFVQEEEERRKQNESPKGKKNKASKSKESDGKRTSSRPDLKSVTKMRQNKEILYPEKRIGHVPGIDVGYQFYSRAEMVAVGFHSHWLNGIDYIGETRGKRDELQQFTFPIAVAIVLSGQYEDDLDNSEDIIYTGQGGHDLLGSKLQCEDQVLVRGNLAMKNSMDQSVPIRVIRGHKNAGSYSGKIYSYDGLYKVVETWADRGCRGHVIYKYRLQRIEGQPKLITDQVQFVRGCPPKTLSELPGLVCRDITNGQEDICIPVSNIYDDPPVGPEGFTYIKSIEVTESVKLPPNSTGCTCKGNCTNPHTCACAKLNGSDFPYVRRHGGRLVEAKDIVFECGPNCGCGPECLNRTSQKGMRYRLEVYRTQDKGWAVRTWDFIPSGAPVCEYIGVLSRSDELDNVAQNDYIFEIDCLHTMNEIEGRERRFGNVPVSATNVLTKIDKGELDGTPEFSIDAGSRGNVARFINHSCEPNLFVQCILSSHHDLRLARVVLFAADNISPMEELTYDYGYALDSVIGPDGSIKKLPCFCGTAECRKRLY